MKNSHSSVKMNFWVWSSLIIVLTLGVLPVFSEDAANPQKTEITSAKSTSTFKTDDEKMSYFLGNDFGTKIGTGLKEQGLDIDIFIQGVTDALTGKPSLVSQEEAQKIMMKKRAEMMAKQEKESEDQLGQDKWKIHLKKPEMMTFDANTDYYWILETNKGTIKIKLMPDVAPMHVTSTIYLTKKGFYDGLIFHRVIPGFMAQGGCPLGTGTGGPGYSYDSECKPNVKHDRPYLLSMANTGRPNSDGSQFFITFKATPWLDGKHTIFGEVTEGQDVVKKLEADGTPSGKPKEELKIIKATIEEVKK